MTVRRTVHMVANVVAGVLNRFVNSNAMPMQKERKAILLQWQDFPMFLGVSIVHTSA